MVTASMPSQSRVRGMADDLKSEAPGSKEKHLPSHVKARRNDNPSGCKESVALPAEADVSFPAQEGHSGVRVSVDVVVRRR